MSKDGALLELEEEAEEDSNENPGLVTVVKALLFVLFTAKTLSFWFVVISISDGIDHNSSNSVS